jgi:hypothetical protein
MSIPDLRELHEYLFEVEALCDHLNREARTYRDGHRVIALKHVIDCVRRVLEGNLTEEEVQNVCHNMNLTDPSCTREQFEEGCRRYQDLLFGSKEEDQS